MSLWELVNVILPYLILKKNLFYFRLWFNIGALSVAVNVSIAIFLIVYLSFIKKVSSDDWERKYPSLIPIATAAFVIGGIL